MKQIKVELKIIIDKTLKSLSFPEKNYSLSISKNIEFGDLSCNIALLLSKNLKKSPMNIGKIIIDRINNNSIKYISNISLTNPGFINFKIHNQFFQSQITTIIEKGEKYGRGEKGIGQTANVEFVSANPTGPLNVGHGRNAVLGDTISSLLEWQGFKVTREYYFNDAGRQMRILAQSVEARYYELLGKNSNFPEDGYLGSYIKDIAQIILDDEGSELPVESTIFKDKAEKIIFNQIKDSLIKLGVNFDQFTNEKTFYENGDIENFIKKLREKNLIYDKDNATWFKTSELGQNKDKVYVKSTGEPTYRVPDTAYHRDKIKRNYDLIIDIFGADHADAYPDVITALKALGYNTDHIKVLIYQFVTLLKGGDKIKMSTRKGDFVTLDQLINDVGVDVVRYFFIMRSMNSHLDFDLDLAADQSDKNPVYYLQYAHARISNILSRASGLNIIMDNEFDPSLIRHNDEISLLKHMVRFPEFIELAYDNLEPQNIANYLQELSARFHKFYNSCRVITDDIELSRSRLAVINAVKIILVNGFSILGITAPERM